jgi:endonuclease YncB( thermonuclease family)
MRRLFIIFLLVGLLWSCKVGAGKRETHYVRWVIDGDTIVLENGQRVRYAGINAPEIRHDDEPGEPFGDEALRANIRLVKNKEVILEWAEEKRDRFGRLLAYVFLPDGTFVQAELVKAGLAFVCYMPPNVRYYEKLLRYERQAIRLRKGLWAGDYFRGEPYYLGNKRSRRFHRPGCSYGRHTASSNRVIFRDMREAFFEGYCPCKKCRPWPGKR